MSAVFEQVALHASRCQVVQMPRVEQYGDNCSMPARHNSGLFYLSYSEQETLARLTMAIDCTAETCTHAKAGVISLHSYQAVGSIANSSV